MSRRRIRHVLSEKEAMARDLEITQKVLLVLEQRLEDGPGIQKEKAKKAQKRKSGGVVKNEGAKYCMDRDQRKSFQKGKDRLFGK